jgi:RNA binding exosome subunit
VKGPFIALHARTFCHATESLDKVQLALATVVGEADIKSMRSEGHHGNPITVLESTIEDPGGIAAFFERMTNEDLETVERQVSSRIDDSCDLFIRLDKQAAYQGEVRLATDADVISVRLRVRAFPSRPEIACDVVKRFLAEKRAKGERQRPQL